MYVRKIKPIMVGFVLLGVDAALVDGVGFENNLG